MKELGGKLSFWNYVWRDIILSEDDSDKIRALTVNSTTTNKKAITYTSVLYIKWKAKCN